MEIVVKPIEEIVANTCSKPPASARKARPQKEQAINCPRYWTEGGSLRSIPVGGGSRKNKRSSASSSSKKLPNLISPPALSQTSTENHRIHEGQDLNLAFPGTQGIRSFTELIQFPSINESNNKTPIASSTSASNNTSQLSALELLTGISSRGLNSFPMPVHQDPSTLYTSGFPLQDFKPTLSFSLDGLGSGYGSLKGFEKRMEDFCFHLKI
ncbi:DOF-TYPE ZINC FINGER DNA-BINDING FAMILY PROTEIN-RELATED [Salix koriyanagi]|uniref:DOF-TYPE ZINC FINGER DNA-BINDING FAMILY PROTEIN-RELATED n=1 Tax=Salix koriyanagi TaxID=2511006 RepID=A0A9Q0T658_9ROSI|nr:DOF-TYPE ZINC FINGER DNA-BINDING FAMILY PROTEIN-RELATED [Salix koriyanagi]